MSKDVESVVTVGYIGPIKASELRNIGAVVAPKSEEVVVHVPLDIPGIHSPKFVSMDPIVLTPETLEHAKKCAQRLVDSMGNLPMTSQAGDLLSMAFAILHFSKGQQ